MSGHSNEKASQKSESAVWAYSSPTTTTTTTRSFTDTITSIDSCQQISNNPTNVVFGEKVHTPHRDGSITNQFPFGARTYSPYCFNNPFINNKPICDCIKKNESLKDIYSFGGTDLNISWQPQLQKTPFGQINTGMNSNFFGNPFGFQMTNTGTSNVKYQPITQASSIGEHQVRFNCINCMKEYEDKSLEELRLEDYIAKLSRNSMFKTPIETVHLTLSFKSLNQTTQIPFGNTIPPCNKINLSVNLGVGGSIFIENTSAGLKETLFKNDTGSFENPPHAWSSKEPERNIRKVTKDILRNYEVSQSDAEETESPLNDAWERALLSGLKQPFSLYLEYEPKINFRRRIFQKSDNSFERGRKKTLSATKRPAVGDSNVSTPQQNFNERPMRSFALNTPRFFGGNNQPSIPVPTNQSSNITKFNAPKSTFDYVYTPAISSKNSDKSAEAKSKTNSSPNIKILQRNSNGMDNFQIKGSGDSVGKQGNQIKELSSHEKSALDIASNIGVADGKFILTKKCLDVVGTKSDKIDGATSPPDFQAKTVSTEKMDITDENTKSLVTTSGDNNVSSGNNIPANIISPQNSTENSPESKGGLTPSSTTRDSVSAPPLTENLYSLLIAKMDAMSSRLDSISKK